ncbi:MAG: hypothetical protein JWR16_3015, partial [Nevskia sp.]|nr:hypothetical protein [Nevskia sp.]
FSASIPVLDASAQDLESLQVALASAADFERSGIERADYLSSLTLKLESGAGGTRVQLSSAQTDHEPFLNFLVEARWQGGRLQREYTVLLDPPNLQANQPAAASAMPATAAAVVEPVAPTATPAPTEPPALEPYAASPPVPSQPAPPRAAALSRKAEIDEAATTSATSTKTYGPVDPQETLWSIAGKLKPDAATTDQILLALYQANPGAFDHGRFNGLMRGATLTVPTDDQIEALAPAAASARVAQLRRGGRLASDSGDAAELAAPAVPAKKAKAAKAAAEPSAGTADATAAPAPQMPSAAAASATPVPAPLHHDAGPSATSGSAAGASTAAPPAAPAASSVLPTGPAEPTNPPTPASASVNTNATPPANSAAPITPPAEPVTAPVEPVTAPSPSNTDASTTAGDTASSAAATTAAVPNKAALAPAPAPKVSLVDDFRLPLLAIVVVLLVGFLGWRMTREKESAPSAFPPLAPKLPVAPTTTVADPESSRTPSPAAGFGKQPVGTAPHAIESAAALMSKAKPATVPLANAPAKTVADVDLTSQLQAQTVAVNLDANDPLAEADFHLAYGLNDEAATLLRRAIEKEPLRKDLRIKLAETYFRAGKMVEFQQTALALRGQIAAADWHKLAEMGRQIAPQIGAFREDDAIAPVVAESVRAEPAAITPVPQATLLDFNLDEPAAAAGVAAPASRPAESNNLIDFDLDAALSNFGQKPAPAELAAAPTPEIDAKPSDLSPAAAPLPAAAEPVAEFKLEDLDLSQSFPDSKVLTSEDETSTKLDLARAYADMGDNEAATGLLNEVIAVGSGAQKLEAEALAKRLHAA